MIAARGLGDGPVQAPPTTHSERRPWWGRPPVWSHPVRQPELAGTEPLASLAGKGFSPEQTHPQGSSRASEGSSRGRSIHGCRMRLASLHPY